MTPPETIPFSSIILGERARSTYTGIEQLAQLVEDNGLVQPIVLVPLGGIMGGVPNGGITIYEQFGLDAGGRRYHALKLLLSEGKWDGVLHHAVTCEPGRPGYVLKGEAFSTPLQRLMTELAENLGRADMDWRDETKLLVKAWRLAKLDAHRSCERILMSDFGIMAGTDYQNLLAAEAIHDDLVLNPQRYKDVTSIRGAYVKVFKAGEAELTKVLVAKERTENLHLLVDIPAPVQLQFEPERGHQPLPTVVPLSSAFINCNSLEYMAALPGPTFDHIVTDPDYGVSEARLNSNMTDSGVGIQQDSVADSLIDLRVFIAQSWRVLKDQGFLIFWYDLDHHEKLQQWAVDIGFKVQRWPLIWHKTDSFSNADPGHNFTKNMEYAMVCRKPNAVLAQIQKTSIFGCNTGTTTKEFNHPFAKPIDVWKWIFSAISIPGQVVYDPFLGSGSSSVAATLWGLKAVGSEIDTEHYNSALQNLQGAFKKLIGERVVFT